MNFLSLSIQAWHSQFTTMTPNFFAIADLILPWLTPQELSSISCTCRTLSLLSKRIATLRSSDASRSFEPLPIPFINPLQFHPQPYAFFLYTPTYLLPSPDFLRQFWGSASLSNPNPQFNFSNYFALGGCGCCCTDICNEDCSCSVLRGGEVVTECGIGCKCDASCGNRVSQKGVSVRLKIVRIQNKGWGLFADQFIPQGSFICEYAGELLNTEEARRRQQVYDKLTGDSRFSPALLVVREYLPSRKACFRINIDATRIGNIARFINHSCDGGNLSTVLVRSSGVLLPRVCFFSSRDIRAGDELSFSYGEVRLKSEGLRCFCGSSSCYGILPSEDT
ncbi:unnamed protein product [Amaranthus hypochondriacus]